MQTNNEVEENHNNSPRPTCTVETFNNELNVSVQILNEDWFKSVCNSDCKYMHDRHCSRSSPDTLCELTNMQSYVAQEPESVVRSQLY